MIEKIEDAILAQKLRSLHFCNLTHLCIERHGYLSRKFEVHLSEVDRHLSLVAHLLEKWAEPRLPAPLGDYRYAPLALRILKKLIFGSSW